MDCELARVSLGMRSSVRRPTVLRSLFDELGDPFATYQRLPPVFMRLDARCGTRCHEERHARVTHITSDGTNALTDNFRTFCRSCPGALRPADRPCPDPADGWTVELPAVRVAGHWIVSATDVVTEEQRQLASRVHARIVRDRFSSMR